MVSLKENFNNFLFYLEKVRRYASSSIVTSTNTFNQVHSSLLYAVKKNSYRIEFYKKLNKYSKAYPMYQVKNKENNHNAK